ncbi:unnamed protein product [Rotaria sordida]|uniref:Choline transporter-like protein n=1 Tax=Rotaria sordida TaxID=392033 RepID=A0A819R534_9BILA|nr:unnamed protein product [Rotaria sordida]CAF1297069.1 unnamed protein product [Rotaria sordida]CAF3625807.1 unnamed protein product [Rotaria sordida]CAF4034285.1 unnamed protein product [Rotaria sordida]
MKTPIILTKDARFEPPKEVLRRKRFCTGDPRQLLHPTDSQGNLCGSEEYANQPYVYFFDWTKFCVEQWPTVTSNYKFENDHANRVCTYDVAQSNHHDEELVKAEKCASYIIASRPLFGQCVPQHIQNLTNSIIQTPGRNESNATVYDSNGQPLSGSRLEQGVKYLVDFLNLKQIGAMLVEDFTTSWKYIRIAFAIAATVSFVWIVLMHWLAKPIVWLVREKNDNQILTEFKFVADANYYRSLPITWLIIAILSTLLLLISALILLVLFKRLRIALAILQEASKAVAYNFCSLFWPFIPFLLNIAIFAYWAFVTVYLATAGKLIYRTALDETATNSTNVTYGEICDPNKWNNSFFKNDVNRSKKIYPNYCQI